MAILTMIGYYMDIIIPFLNDNKKKNIIKNEYFIRFDSGCPMSFGRFDTVDILCNAQYIDDDGNVYVADYVTLVFAFFLKAVILNINLRLKSGMETQKLLPMLKFYHLEFWVLVVNEEEILICLDCEKRMAQL